MTTQTMQVAAIRPLTDRIAEFELKAAGGEALPDWQPGAHIRVSLPDGGDRAYSLIAFDAARGSQPACRVAVQLEPEGEGGSRFMHGLKTGDELAVTPPKCDFPLAADTPVVLLAGGIGITPMISMAAELAAKGTEFALHYAGRSRGVMAYADRLADRFGDALHLHCDDEPENALDLDALVKQLGADRHLYICGPRGMIDAARAAAEKAGIAAERIHVELFDNASSAQDGDAPFEVEVASTGDVFTIPPGRTIIDVLEEGGVDLMYDCQRGDCGICQTDVISGTPDHRDVVLSEAEREAGKVIQICVSRAKSARLVLDL
ncbi:PDR/VanB family oxidoreductase [Oricola sp.]|uniref:PDR/VanB family oxidoreductase n=1 Tax=Oricola sp. TaxID=1979950 RepID=UPI0025F8A70A|nr:PDR/VanB family oxidoreductase [Oricola sp.]MCI5076036.1 PDR/VanB family oxidoreductase [Oricola sp.]